MAEQPFSGRPDDIEKKEREEWDPHRMFWMHVAVSGIGVLILASGAVLAHTA